MAVIKHIASKNADYGESERYLIFQHNEYTQKPILDDEGHMILRDEYYLDGLNCDPFTFASECQELNSFYHKNKKFNEIKSHHYIISFDPKDREECGLTGERAQQLGLTFAKKKFPGHQALVCTHTDGHNESGNIHGMTFEVLRSLFLQAYFYIRRSFPRLDSSNVHLLIVLNADALSFAS